MAGIIECPACKTIMVPAPGGVRGPDACPACRRPLISYIFPAFYKPLEESSRGELVVLDSEATCFYHPAKRADVPCDVCGKFLCSLCAIDLDDKQFCPGCVEKSREKGVIKQLEKRRVLYDDIALSLSLVPILFWPVTLVTAPAALYTIIRYWKTPGSIVPRGKKKFILAGIIAILQIIAWAGVGVLIYKSWGQE